MSVAAVSWKRANTRKDYSCVAAFKF